MLQICNIARKQSPIHFGKDFTVHVYKMDNLGIMTELNPATYYTQQLKGKLNYSIHQSGRGLGSHLFNIVKSVGTSLLKKKNVKAEAGQVIKDITSGVGERKTVSHERQRSYI